MGWAVCWVPTRFLRCWRLVRRGWLNASAFHPAAMPLPSHPRPQTPAESHLKTQAHAQAHAHTLPLFPPTHTYPHSQVRLFLVHNWVPQSTLGRVAAPFEVYALFYNIWFAYSECEC